MGIAYKKSRVKRIRVWVVGIHSSKSGCFDRKVRSNSRSRHTPTLERKEYYHEMV